MKTWALRFSPDLEIERNDAGDGASERDGRFTGQRFAQDLDAAGCGAGVYNVDLRERNVGKLFVAPEKSGGWREKADVQAIIAAFAVEQRDELIEAIGGAARAAKGKTARSAIEKVGVADEDAESGAARRLVGDVHGRFFHARNAAVGTQEHADAESFTGSGFASFEPGAFDGERFAAGDGFDALRLKSLWLGRASFGCHQGEVERNHGRGSAEGSGESREVGASDIVNG